MSIPDSKTSTWRRFAATFAACSVSLIVAFMFFFLAADQIHSWRPPAGFFKFLFFIFDSPFVAFVTAAFLTMSFAKLMLPELPAPWLFVVLATPVASLPVPFVFMMMIGSSPLTSWLMIGAVFLATSLITTLFCFFSKGKPQKKWQLSFMFVAAFVLLLHFVPWQNYYLTRMSPEARDELALTWFGESYVQVKQLLRECTELEQVTGELSSIVASGGSGGVNQNRSFFLDFEGVENRGTIKIGAFPRKDGWYLSSVGLVTLNGREPLLDFECYDERFE